MAGRLRKLAMRGRGLGARQMPSQKQKPKVPKPTKGGRGFYGGARGQMQKILAEP